jgi:pyrophosphatase PpaX
MIATYRAHNQAHHDAMVKRYPGALEAVRALKSRGARVGVVTSKLRSSAHRGLALCGFDGLFDVVIGADDVQRPMPDGEPVRRALDALGAAPEGAIMVGDSPHDIAAGRAAGVRTAAALWGPFPRSWLEREAPDYWLVQPSDIAGLA